MLHDPINSPFFREEVEVGEGWLDDDCEVVSLVPPAVDERADLLHVAVQQARHLLPAQWSSSKPAIETGTDPAVSDVTKWMFIIPKNSQDRNSQSVQNSIILTCPM